MNKGRIGSIAHINNPFIENKNNLVFFKQDKFLVIQSKKGSCPLYSPPVETNHVGILTPMAIMYSFKV